MSNTRRERLMEIQKREQLKGMLINKFKLKYGNKPELSRFIDNEVGRFLANDRLTEGNLKNLDTKIGKEADNRDKKSQILDDRKSVRSQSAYSQGRVSRKSAGGLSAQALSALNGQNDKKSQAGDVRSRASRRSGASQGRPAYAASIASSQRAPTEVYSEINENEEWVAIQKFNTLLHYEEQKQSLLREAERKRLIREELDRQVLQKLQRKNNEGQEDRVYDEMYEEHGKLLEQREKEKAQANMDKIISDKQSRDLQMRDEKKRKKMEEKENMASEQEYIRRL